MRVLSDPIWPKHIFKKGNETYNIDDLSTGSMDNIKHLQKNADYKQSIFVHINTILHQDLMLELIGICDRVYCITWLLRWEFV